MRRIDVIALIAVIVVAALGKFSGYGGGAPDAVNPRRPSPGIMRPAPVIDEDALRPLPGAARSDPSFIVKVGPASPSVGTAFSIDNSGRWLTARHVIEGCNTVVIRTGERKGVRVGRIVTHPNADVAVLWTRGGAPPLSISGAGLRTGQNGFHLGFPNGLPGDMHGRLIGRRTMKVAGRYRTQEPVVAWTQLRRVPDRGADLSGISGGPVLDQAGSVIGVVVAGAPRRGRTYSAAPRSLAEAMARAKLEIGSSGAAGTPHPRLNGRDFPAHGDDLRRHLTVAKVFCRVDEGRPGRSGGVRRPRI